MQDVYKRQTVYTHSQEMARFRRDRSGRQPCGQATASSTTSVSYTHLVPLADVAGKLKTVDPKSQMIKEAKRTGICFGD